ncbi:cyclase family protein [Candidatus Gottesmanbacteria bacterium]|nr:cyclase family protein [Candidatus Gottesmanbacteria bacterium]
MRYKYIDLSLPFTSNLPVFPGDPSPQIKKIFTIAKDGCSVHSYSFVGHTGTHMDAPSHFIPGGKSLSELPLTTFSGKGIVLDCRGQNPIHSEIKDHITKYNDTVVLIRTDYSKNWKRKDYFSSYSVLSEGFAKGLTQARVKMVGIDSPSPDKDPFPIHKIILGAGIPIMENLTNFDRLTHKVFRVFAFPLSTPTDGVPVRVVAEVEGL